MSDISEKQLVHAPLSAAQHLLKAFMAAHKAPQGDGSRVVLQAAGFEQPAVVTVAPAHRPADMTPRYAVTWKSETNDAMFPIFDGFLTVEADQDYDAFWLKIQGSYAPPGGVAGKLFDAVVGNRIAMTTTQNLLISIRDAAEAQFRSDEAKKPHTRA
jgi:hypothetical protein